jgi:hypothetical protein
MRCRPLCATTSPLAQPPTRSKPTRHSRTGALNIHLQRSPSLHVPSRPSGASSGSGTPPSLGQGNLLPLDSCPKAPSRQSGSSRSSRASSTKRLRVKSGCTRSSTTATACMPDWPTAKPTCSPGRAWIGARLCGREAITQCATERTKGLALLASRPPPISYSPRWAAKSMMHLFKYNPTGSNNGLSGRIACGGG